MTWRLAPGAERVEPVEVMVRRPEYQPKTWAHRTCLVVVEDVRLVSGPDPRCDVAPRPLPAATPTRPGQTAWCAVDVEIRDGEISARPAGCSDAFPEGVETVVSGWAFPTERDRTWRVLLGATGPATGSRERQGVAERSTTTIPASSHCAWVSSPVTTSPPTVVRAA